MFAEVSEILVRSRRVLAGDALGALSLFVLLGAALHLTV
jgi:hypothetical protein